MHEARVLGLVPFVAPLGDDEGAAREQWREAEDGRLLPVAAVLVQVDVGGKLPLRRPPRVEGGGAPQAPRRVEPLAQRAVQRRAQVEHREAETAKRLKAEIKEADKTLRERKAAVATLEDILETKHAMKTFTPELIGQGQKKAGGAKGQRARLEVLDRLAHLGAGLSPAQRNDWAWFKTAWDAKMVSEHDDEWPALFAGWIQQVLEELALEAGSNAFSRFVHQETLRCLSEQDALRIPAV